MSEPPTSPADPPPTQQRVPARKVIALFGAILIVAVAIAGTVWLTAGRGPDEQSPSTTSFVPTAFELRGTLTLLEGGTGIADRGECAGYRGYSDIAEGAQVTVYDASGKAVALGNLENAQYRDGVCSFEFVVGNVPLGQNIYQVEVSHRGKVSYTLDQAKSGRVFLTLGNP